ncbi:hypothetical protein [Terriglobus roseus]|uniref:Uncharacterized protein n=1 Tax=Terriglobus roseus TaxID=392734 RepID=A0A1H4TBF4_9BACT|nr:hypothetical protein [Terriglobus roseus]SEC53795.1 hypothetical protein SAMN05443244_3706 [Terriglobus roseus]
MTARFPARVAGLRGTSIFFALLALGTRSLLAQGLLCPSRQFEGQVEAGKSFRRPMDRSHDFVLESIASGWIVRVLPASGPRPMHDYAELATPPYRSPNPLLISTDFSFRAQDAIAWNPREFHFFTTGTQLATATRALEATEREPNHPSAGAALFPLLPQACTAELRITDARIAGGTADQAATAAMVASHFAQTAHTLETDATPTKLGRIVSLHFRVLFQGSKPASSH